MTTIRIIEVTTMIETRWELKNRSRVMATDGPAGRVQHVIVDPEQHRTVALVVLPSRRAGYAVVVPFEQVADVAEDGTVWLKISRAQLAALPGFGPQQYLELANGRRGYLVEKARATGVNRAGRVSATTLPVLALRQGQDVLGLDGHAGHVEMLLSDARGEVRHFVLHRGHLRGRDVIVPVDWVREVDERNVYLSVTHQALEDLPEYTPDSALAAEVDRALWNDTVLRESGDYHTIDLTLREGIVVLKGHMASSAFKARAERVARGVPGVLDVDNQLVADDDLANRVAQALTGDERTRGQSVRVYAQHGVVYLKGEASSAEIRDAAERCAASLPHVRGVINDLKAPDAIIADVDQRVLQPRIGQEVITTDVPVGRVERVIINPRNRRVTAFVVHGQFPDSDHSDPHTLPVNLSERERRVVIPVAVVRDVTIGGVLLNIGSVEAARYDDFDTARFSAPDAGWQPPYPYRHADVLLDLRHAEKAGSDSSTIGRHESTKVGDGRAEKH